MASQSPSARLANLFRERLRRDLRALEEALAVVLAWPQVLVAFNGLHVQVRAESEPLAVHSLVIVCLEMSSIACGQSLH